MSPILDPNLFYHSGYVCADLEESVQVFSAQTGLTFEAPTAMIASIRTPKGVREVEFHVSYSAEGPNHIELVQQIPGTLWVTDKPATLHHIGYWSNNLEHDSSRLESGGMTRVMAHEPDVAGQPSLYCYYQSSLGPYVELVDVSLRSFLEEGWANTLRMSNLSR